MQRRLALTTNTQIHRLQTLQQGPGVERAHRGAGVANERLQRTRDVVALAKHGATHHASLTVNVLGGRVDHHIGAQLERSLERRRCKHVVNNHDGARGVCQSAHLGHVHDVLHRVGRRLEEHHIGRGRQRLRPLGVVVRVNVDGLDAPAGEQFVQHEQRGAEHGPTSHDARSRLGKAGHGGEHGCHAGRRREACFGALDQAKALLESRRGRVGVAGVGEPVELAEKGGFGVGRLGVGVALGEEERFGDLLEPRPLLAATHREGGGAEAFGQSGARLRVSHDSGLPALGGKSGLEPAGFGVALIPFEHVVGGTEASRRGNTCGGERASAGLAQEHHGAVVARFEPCCAQVVKETRVRTGRSLQRIERNVAAQFGEVRNPDRLPFSRHPHIDQHGIRCCGQEVPGFLGSQIPLVAGHRMASVQAQGVDDELFMRFLHRAWR